MSQAREMINAHLFPILAVVATVSSASVAIRCVRLLSIRLVGTSAITTALLGIRPINLIGRFKTKKFLPPTSAMVVLLSCQDLVLSLQPDFD